MRRLLNNIIVLGIVAVLAATLVWSEGSSTVLERTFRHLTEEKTAISAPTKTAVLTTQTITPPVSTASENDSPFSVGNIVDATNRERIKAGLAPLSVNTNLNTSAAIKTQDMIARHYFEHISPSGEGVSDLGTRVGYDYIVIGENLALGDFKNADELLDAWMKSPGHRANILNANYHEVGVYAARGTYEGHEVWFAVQHFGTSRATCPAISTSLKQSIDTINAELKRQQTAIIAKKEVLESPNHPTGEEYEKQVGEYNEMVAQYNALLVTSQSQVAQYNAQVKAFNTCLSTYQKK